MNPGLAYKNNVYRPTMLDTKLQHIIHILKTENSRVGQGPPLGPSLSTCIKIALELLDQNLNFSETRINRRNCGELWIFKRGNSGSFLVFQSSVPFS